MRIVVRVRPGARRTLVTEDEQGLTVHTPAIPEAGKANQAVIRLVAEHFKVAPSRVRIILGKTAREKLLEIDM